jgi:hypothetical protein
MKVIGAGLPRTATTTQLQVLEQLGFSPCYHMRDLMADLESGLPPWERVAEGDPDWDAIFDGYESCCDWPSARYYKELAEHFPQAKVLLSVRSADGWVRSMRETIWPMYFGDSVLHHVNQARGQVEPNWGRFLELMTHQCWDPRTGAMAGAETADDAGLAEIMERWNQRVIDSIAPERLLVWNPADGWEPLCAFLDVPIPEGEVPRVNDTAAFKEGIIGRGLAALNEWWGQRDRPAESLHGTTVE